MMQNYETETETEPEYIRPQSPQKTKTIVLAAPISEMDETHHHPKNVPSAHNVSKHVYTLLGEHLSSANIVCDNDDDAAFGGGGGGGEADADDNNDDNDNDTKSEKISPIYDLLTEDEIEQIETFIADSVCDYLKTNVKDMSYPLFHEEMVEQIAYYLYCDWHELGICASANYGEIIEWVDYVAIQCYNDVHIPFRSLRHEDADLLVIPKCSVAEITNTLARLRAIPQPTQKTEEWYASRHNMLTASNAWKALSTEAQFNSLVYEKCRPFDAASADKMSSVPNPTSKNPMHWGVKYEPVSVMIYEYKNGVSVSDFGCIPHAKYPFLGASPDGIVTDNRQPTHYGRMIEVKNIVNREIDGVPLEHYWIQMQLQMEVCDLDECDFIETRFAEFENEHDFYEYDAAEASKGVILYLIPRTKIGEIPDPLTSHKAKYVYMPMDIPTDRASVSRWIDTQKSIHAASHIVYYTMYWRLDEYSCVLVLRNREWFAAALPQIEHCWATILRERDGDYLHRAPAARKREADGGNAAGVEVEIVASGETDQTTHIIKNLPISRHTCLVKLDA